MGQSNPTIIIQDLFRLDHNILSWGSKTLDLNQFNHIWVFGAGKAAASMALGLNTVLKDRICGGVVINPTPDSFKIGKIEIRPGNHPIPGTESLKSTENLIHVLSTTKPNDLILFLISGGASAMLCKPVDGLSLNDLQELNENLLKSGLSIHQMNARRKAASAVKGGKLLSFTQSKTILNLLISDVPGDDPSVIGSGPTQPEISGHSKNKKVTNIWINTPGLFAQKIGNTAKLVAKEQIANDHNDLGETTNLLNKELAVLVHPDPYSGSTKDVCEMMSNRIQEDLKTGSETKPRLHIFCGESEVKVTGDGKGGRNQHLALHFLVHELPKFKNITRITMLSAGTDGIDGNTEAAGAIIDSEMHKKIDEERLMPLAYLNRFDSYTFFQKLDTLLITGPTKNNLMDIQMILVRSSF